MRKINTSTLVLAVLVFCSGTAAAADVTGPITSAITRSDLDVEQCRAFAERDDAGTAAVGDLAVLLGLEPAEVLPEWTTGPQAREQRYFRITFRNPVPLGTICTHAPQVAYLRDAADYPGDVTNDRQWQELAGGPIYTLPVAVSVRAVRLTYPVHNLPWDTTRRATTCDPVLLLAGRFWDPAAIGGQDRSKLKGSSSKRGEPAPEQWLGYWPTAQSVAGVASLLPTASGVEYALLPAAAASHPRLATADEWRPLPVAPAPRGPAIVPFASAVPAVALRAKGSLPKGKSWLAALVPLKDGEQPPTSFVPSAPFAVRYELPQAGFVALNVADESGRHVRRLIAEVSRASGSVVEPWDLTDDAGQMVPPGKYQFTGVVRPPLRLTHEITVYNPGSPPWNAPVPGGGGWMADHSPPMSCCAVGDKLFFGAAGAEFGYALIATDLQGRKVWSDSAGAQRLVSDGRYAYVVNNDEIVRIDPQSNFAKEKVYKFQYDERTPGHAKGYLVADRSGAAARPGLLAVAYQSSAEAWIRSTFKPGDVDLKQITPPVYPKSVHATELTPTEKIYSTFQAGPSSTAAHFGDADNKGPLANTLVLPFTKEVPLGSVLVPDGATEVWALKPGQTLPKGFQPPDPSFDGMNDKPKKSSLLENDLLSDLNSRFDTAIWQRLPADAADRPALAVPKEGMMTRAVVFTGPSLKRLDYGLLLDRRYRNAAATAKVVVSEGKVTTKGAWQFQRPAPRPISLADPVTAVLAWDRPVALRGCIVLRPLEWSGLALDVWVGPNDAVPDPQAPLDDGHWREVHRHRQTRNHIKYSWHTNRVITADFGEVVSTRGLRLRYIEPPQGNGATAKPIVQGGFEGLLALEPAGNDAVIPANLAHRVTLLDLPEAGAGPAKLRGHLPLAGAGALTFDREGVLYAVADRGIVRLKDLNVSTSSPAWETVVPADVAGRPRALAFRADGMLYLLDGAAKQVRVFDPRSGRELQTIGKSPVYLGNWNPEHFDTPVAMTFDQAGKLWVVEQQFQPKRISRWSADGQFEQELLGPTHYGGGGMMDPRDRTVVNHLGMKFRIDYDTRTWKLESRLAGYGGGYYLPDRTAYVGEQRHLIGDRPVVTPFGDAGPTCVVCREIDGVAVPVVAAGVLGDWKELSSHSELAAKARELNALKTGFVWADTNGDRQVQADEVQFVADREVRRGPYIGDDLSLNFPTVRDGGVRLRVQSMLPDGTPQYDASKIEELPELTGDAMVTSRGETFVLGHKLLASDGKKLWTYRDRYLGIQASYQTPWGFYGRPPGELAGGFSLIGYFEIAGETLYCVGGNNGDYFAFTHDGLLAATLVGGPRGYGRRFFSIADYQPGATDLSDLRKTVEDFHGHVTRAEDGHVYVIAGKNHATVLRVDGLERMQRFSGNCVVTSDDLERSRAWTQESGRIARFLSSEGPKVYAVTALRRGPTIDGELLADWPDVEPLTIAEIRGPDGKEIGHWKAQLAYDSENLYVAGSAVDASPLENSAADRRTLFQNGDALDFQLGLDPDAPADRIEAVPGDVRLVLTAVGDEPVCMVYRYRMKSKSPQEPVVFRSPTGEIAIDEIQPLDVAKLAFIRGPRSWTIEAAIPWSALGVKAPTKTTRLRGDLGAIESDPQGTATIARHYWANRSQVILSDLPSEARVLPSLWGEFRFEVTDSIDALLDPGK
jgi:hypothetical protein